MGYVPTIGLEVHVQLLTKSKAFCGCATTFGAEPNTATCPVCLGLPGVLPVLNHEMVALGLRVALAVGGTIAELIKFERKNYFYPDLPKNFQISQYELPLATGGSLELPGTQPPRRIPVRRVHLEEDAGKLLHPDGRGESLVDFNRSGIPLMEIVSEPAVASPEDAYAYLTELKLLLQYLGVSDCNMEEGSLRCDANISVRREEAAALGTKVEIKNLNSFKAVKEALQFEAGRQATSVTAGTRIVQETRLWDEARGETRSMRSKEEAHDYRYFPEPDLVPLVVDRGWIEAVRRALPELPAARRARFSEGYGLPPYDAGVLTASRPLADYFEACVAVYPHPKRVSNWIMAEVLALVTDRDVEVGRFPVRPDRVVELLTLVDRETVSGKMAKELLREMAATGQSAAEIVARRQLSQLTDDQAVEAVVDEVLARHAQAVAQYRGGKVQALTFLVGQVMVRTKGQAHPQKVNTVLKRRLAEPDERGPRRQGER